jgi:ATP-dependent DNA helicase Q4
VSIAETVTALDLPEENISTLLCYLENDETRQWLKLQNPVYSHCKIRCYNGPRQLKAVAQKSPPVAAAVAMAKKKGEIVENTAQIEFPVVSISAAMGWNSGTVKRELKNLQWANDGVRYRKSGVMVEMSNLAFHFDALRGLSEEERDHLKNFLYGRVSGQERRELHSLNRIFRSFSIVSHAAAIECSVEADTARSDRLKQFIEEYFGEPADDDDPTTPTSPSSTAKKEVRIEDESRVRSEVRQFVMTHSDHTWSGRAVARVFHGIASPNFPAQQWGRVFRYWRSHIDVDFNALCKLANREVVGIRTGRA